MVPMWLGPVSIGGWPSGNHHHWDAFGIGAGGCVDQTERTGSVGHDNSAQAPQSGVAIRRVTRIQLVTGRHVFDVAGDQRFEERQDIVSRDAEQMIDSETLEATKKKFCDGHDEDNSKLSEGFGSDQLFQKGSPGAILTPASRTNSAQAQEGLAKTNGVD